MITVEAFHTTRFGTLEVPAHDVIRFPSGLIGLPGSDYVLIPAPRGAFTWLQSLTDGALALPLTDPYRFFPDFSLELGADAGVPDSDAAQCVYVTVRATPDPAQCTANLRAPIVICGQEAHQVVNVWAAAAIRVPLFGAVSTVGAGETGPRSPAH